ncbi:MULTISPECIES: M20 family metallo-hydrolase [Pseudomonas]|uniref:M20 family metallo-hydrolase n=1 Tax=Pseudomonas sp. FW305-E2 TaxID=2075558 RepID=UPI00117A0F8B|nr:MULTISPECIES: M20 family metallo-hydrolase [Pseudomonas]
MNIESLKENLEPGRLWSDLMTLGAIGVTPRGGSSRVALSDADRDARNLFVYWAKEAGMTIKVDRIGNIFARREGQEPELPPVMVGSHLDTQTPGGKFDGILGVLAGLEVVRAMNRSKLSFRRSVEVAVWTNEEGVRFPGLMGSSVFAKLKSVDQALSDVDKNGISVATELKRIGYAGKEPVGGRALDSYIELHIEQGALLEKANVTIGAVTNSSWWAIGNLTVHGSNGHAQTAPMSHRKNALYGAAQLISQIEQVGLNHEPHGMVSVTEIECLPNNMINLPHYCNLKYLIVHDTEAGRSQIIKQITDIIATVKQETGLLVDDDSELSLDRLDFSPELLELTESAAESMGYKSMRLSTLTGHDALQMHHVCPTAIIFVPCEGGLSHCEEEWCSEEHVTAGAQVLLAAVASRAGTV